MTTDDEAWRAEERFWFGGAEHFREALDPACVMAFPAPVGIMQGAGIAESLADAPRWSSLDMTDRHVARPAPDLLVLAYKARGIRDGAVPYLAYCTSTYRRDGGGWRLVQHQQTPA